MHQEKDLKNDVDIYGIDHDKLASHTVYLLARIYLFPVTIFFISMRFFQLRLSVLRNKMFLKKVKNLKTRLIPHHFTQNHTHYSASVGYERTWKKTHRARDRVWGVEAIEIGRGVRIKNANQAHLLGPCISSCFKY